MGDENFNFESFIDFMNLWSFQEVLLESFIEILKYIIIIICQKLAQEIWQKFMKSSNTFLLIKLVGLYWFKSVSSNLFDPAGHMRINLEAAGRNRKLKSRDKNSLNKINIIN